MSAKPEVWIADDLNVPTALAAQHYEQPFEHSASLYALAAALALAQGEMTGALKDSANPFFKSKYADLASCWDAARGPLSKNGLSITQFPITRGDKLELVTMLLHKSGQWMRGSLHIDSKDDSAQAVGGAITYMRRYAFAASTGIAQVDDDGNQASGRPAQAYSAPHSPKGDLGKNVDINEARAVATAIRGILELDIEDRVKALKVLDKHDQLNKDQDLYSAASDQLSSKERADWKAYYKEAAKREKEDREVTNVKRTF